MRKVALFAAAVALPPVAGAAEAGTVTFLQSQNALLPNEQVVFDFNDPARDGAVTGSGYKFLTDTSTQGALPAAGDGSRYLSVLGGGLARIAMQAGGVTGFSLDLGSLDTYNTLTIGFADNTSRSLTGGQLVSNANGDQVSPNTNGRFRFQSEAGQRITSVSFASGSNSFEVDRIAVTPVPEPATWALMIGGFGMIGFATRRRRAPRFA